MEPSFFGLDNNYAKNLYDMFFYLKYYGGFSLTESYNLPIRIRDYYVKKLIEQMQKETEQIQDAQRDSKRK